MSIDGEYNTNNNNNSDVSLVENEKGKRKRERGKRIINIESLVISGLTLSSDMAGGYMDNKEAIQLITLQLVELLVEKLPLLQDIFWVEGVVYEIKHLLTKLKVNIYM